MESVRVAMFVLVLATALGCRAIRDDQETRPLPPPEPPPARTPQTRTIDRAARSEVAPRAPRAPSPVAAPQVDERLPSPGADPSAAPALQAPEAPVPAPAPEASARAADPACVVGCQSTLAACVTAPSDAGDALEGCKSAFEACKSGC